MRPPGKYFVLAAVLAAHVLCWVVLRPPVPHADDRVYMDLARDMGEGRYALNESPKNHRFMVIVPAWAIASVAGTSPYAVSAWPLLCSLATVAAVFLFLYKEDRQLATVAAVLLALNPVQVIYSTVLFPDAVVSLFFALAAGLVVAGRHGRFAWRAVLAALVLGAGFAAKEIIVLFLPFIVGLSIRDAVAGRHAAFWQAFFPALAIVALAIWGFYYALTGDAAFLVRSVETRHNDMFVPPLRMDALWRRMVHEPLLWLVSQPGYVVLVVLTLPWLFRRQGGMARVARAYLVLLAAAFWWGSSSLQRMAPVPLADRMWMPLLVPLCVAAAFSARDLFRTDAPRQRTVFHAALFGLAGSVWLVSGSWKFAAVLFVYAAGCLLVPRIRQGMAGRHASWPEQVWVLPYVLTTVYFILNNVNR